LRDYKDQGAKPTEQQQQAMADWLAAVIGKADVGNGAAQAERHRLDEHGAAGMRIA
jgi:hypothetical protein